MVKPLGLTFGLLCLAALGGTPATARSLSEQLDALASRANLGILGRDHVAHFQSAALAIQGRLVGQLAASAADLPAISTAPGFTYAFNVESGAPERITGSLGPIFVDRVETVGRGRLGLGAAYMLVDFTELDGEDLEGVTRTLEHSKVLMPDGQPVPFTRDTISLTFDRFTLRSHVMSLFATYGLTDRWDVNVLLPVLDTQLRVKAHARINVNSDDFDAHLFENGTFSEQLPSIDDGKVGVGDLLLRTKYRLPATAGLNFAPALTLRIPTGDKENFQGLGDTTVTPLVIVSRELGRHDLHMSAGIECDTAELDRSRARYGAGATIGLADRLALVVDFLGSSGLTNQRITAEIPDFGETPETSGMRIGSHVISESSRTDMLNLATGFKVNPYGTLIAFATAIVPLNSGGLRADVIPVGGVEWNF